MSVYLLSYTGTHAGLPGLVNRGIRVLDSTPYSHTEMCVSHPFEGVAECYSSSGVDHGVRRKDMVLSRDKWDALYLPWADASQVRAFYEKTKGAGYDFWGTARFAVPFLLREHPELYFCSEWGLASISVADAWRFSPAGARALCLSRGAVSV